MYVTLIFTNIIDKMYYTTTADGESDTYGAEASECESHPTNPVESDHDTEVDVVYDLSTDDEDQIVLEKPAESAEAELSTHITLSKLGTYLVPRSSCQRLDCPNLCILQANAPH
jgi:hypothetical protein